MGRQRQSPRSLELFSGAGGLALGIGAAGFDHRLLLEYNGHACKTLRRNIGLFGGPACHIGECDVRAFDFRPYAGADLLAAGAPCQPFSIAGRHRADKDERNLFPQVFRAVREVSPRAIIIENVKGLLRPGLSDFVEYVELQLAHPHVLPKDPLDPDSWKRHLTTLRSTRYEGSDRHDLQYRVRKALLNAADYGVPQKRERVFLVALRRDLGVAWDPPAPTHSESALRLSQDVTGEYWASHGITKPLARNHPREAAWRARAGRTRAWCTVRDALRGMPVPRQGTETRGWSNHVAQPGARSYPGHTGSPLDQPAKTLKAGVHGVPGGENMLRHPNGAVRYFTVREAARLQTFPDEYEFMGAWSEAMRQIGNAVPVSLAAAVAGSVREYLTADGVRPPHEQQCAFVQGELSGLLVAAP